LINAKSLIVCKYLKLAHNRSLLGRNNRLHAVIDLIPIYHDLLTQLKNKEKQVKSNYQTQIFILLEQKNNNSLSQFLEKNKNNNEFINELDNNKKLPIYVALCQLEKNDANPLLVLLLLEYGAQLPNNKYYLQKITDYCWKTSNYKFLEEVIDKEERDTLEALLSNLKRSKTAKLSPKNNL
jgi:formylmethanofuran dehydrogenase subunit E-like metal-binding protein